MLQQSCRLLHYLNLLHMITCPDSSKDFGAIQAIYLLTYLFTYMKPHL